MGFAPATLVDLLRHPFDTVIDVRSPAEYALDHVPGAINLPVLNNDERAEVGTIYKQVSPFDARKIGAAMVFRNASRHIEQSLAHHDGSWRPLVYCWRGGQRSGSFAWMLGQIGWRSDVIAGGYKTYRKLIVDMLHDTPLPYHLIQLGGYTGTAKTALLPHLARAGVQVVDLEALAHHRGSLLGGLGPQPSQKAFETALACMLVQLDPTRPVVVEAESSKIGDIMIPPQLWDAMKRAPWIEVEADIALRTEYLCGAYADVLSDHDHLMSRLEPLRHHRGAALVDSWRDLSASGDTRALVRSLMQDHYDPAYAKACKVLGPNVLGRVRAQKLDEAGLQALASEIAAQVQATEI